MLCPLMLERDGQAMLSAALRHIRDAERLAAAGPLRSLDQSFHLSGLAPECARKASLSARTFHQAIGHGVVEASERALAFALAVDPAARRYDLTDWVSRYPALSAWRIGVRYERTGSRSEAETRCLVAEARDIVGRVVYALWADGRLPGDFAW
jgi:hypothetical protein